MAYPSSKPMTTDKFHIDVPTDEYLVPYCVYKIWFGKRYLIWKGKSLFQSVQAIAIQLERALRTGNDDDTSYLYHVWTYIKKARIIRATVEVLENNFEKDPLGFLKAEQMHLDKCENDPDCLNNNAYAYVPKWMGPQIENEFMKWVKGRKNKKKKKSK